MKTYHKTCERCETLYTCTSHKQRFCSHRCAAMRERTSYARPPSSYRDDLQRQIARAVIAARLERNWSQREMARAAGISRGTLTRIEWGNRGYSVQALAMVLDAAGLEIRLSADA